MDFELEAGMEILARTPGSLRSLLTGLSEPWLKSDEGPGTWSTFDILGHLVHGEKTDWIPRARIILAQGESVTFEPFDRFAQENDSAGKSVADLLGEFETLRRASLKELAGFDLTSRELELEGIHPEFGPVSLNQLLATWVVHDLGHIAQITRAMARQYTHQVGPWRKYLGILEHPA